MCCLLWIVVDFVVGCIGCVVCVEVCLEGVLKFGVGWFVEFDFFSVGCMLCGECVSCCEVGLFDGVCLVFFWIVMIGEVCLVLVGIYCCSCQDVCEFVVICFCLVFGGVVLVELDSQCCNGCGVCLVFCLSQVI